MRQASITARQYLIINSLLAGIILLIFIYSAIYNAARDNHPVPSFYEEMTGRSSPSSGMSRAFSEIVRGRFVSAGEYNPDSILIFSFFLIQLLQRGIASLLAVRKTVSLNSLIVVDSVLSVGFFLYCFWGQIQAIGRMA